jgi:two-component system cell cycle response regulator DivK
LPRVLIVDSSAENREVLRTVLARRGLQIFEAGGADRGLELAREHQPDVIVLDLESEQAENSQVEDQFDAEARQQQSALVILGRARRASAAARAQVISKPYHFAPLVHTIEQLAAKAA